MGIRTIALIGLAALLASLNGAAAQDSTASRTRVIDMTRVRVAPPTAERVRMLEERVVSTPARELPVAPDEPAAVVPAPAEAIPETEKGKLYHVNISANDERTIASALVNQPAIRSQGEVIVPLPGVLRQQAQDGTELLLKPFVIPQRLVHDATKRLYSGSIKVGVSEIGGPAPSRDLSAPILFQVLEADVASPEEMPVTRSGMPLRGIRITTPDAADGLTVTVASPFNPEGIPVTLRLGPALNLRLKGVLEGLGLEAATVAVSVTGLEKPEGRVVKLAVDGPAKLTEEILKLDANGNASTEVRSTGAGEAVVRADVTGFRTAEVIVNVAVPYLIIAASAVGGLAGGLIRLLPAVSRGMRTRRFVLGLAVAVLVGLLIFALYAIGVNLLPFTPTVQVGAVLVFAVSAAGAFFGSKLLEGSPAT